MKIYEIEKGRGTKDNYETKPNIRIVWQIFLKMGYQNLNFQENILFQIQKICEKNEIASESLEFRFINEN